MTPVLLFSPWVEDWFVIQPYEGTGQPQGSGTEWRAVLAAMDQRQRCVFLRIGVRFDDEQSAHLWSPRNSLDQSAAIIPANEVDDWIKKSRRILDTYSDRAIRP